MVENEIGSVTLTVYFNEELLGVSFGKRDTLSWDTDSDLGGALELVPI